MANKSQRKLIGKGEVAAMLGVHRHTLTRWLRNHQGPPGQRIGKKIYWTRAAIRAWLDSTTILAQSESGRAAPRRSALGAVLSRHLASATTHRD